MLYIYMFRCQPINTLFARLRAFWVCMTAYVHASALYSTTLCKTKETRKSCDTVLIDMKQKSDNNHKKNCHCTICLPQTTGYQTDG